MHMIPAKLDFLKVISAIQADILVPSEQRAIRQGWIPSVL